jgi:hypothetical protein
VYGHQAQAAAVLGPLAQPVAPVPAQAVQLGEVPLLGREAWREQEQARVNAELVRQVQEANQRTEQANQRAQAAVSLAVASAGSQKQAEVLTRQLGIAERLKQTNFEALKKTEGRVNTVAMRLAGGEPAPAAFLQVGHRLLDKATARVQEGREKVAALQTDAEEAEKRGDYGRVAQLRHSEVPDQEAKNQLLVANLSRFAGGKIRLAELDAQHAQHVADQVRAAAEQVEQVRLTRLAAQQAQEAQTRLIEQQAADKARQEALNQKNTASIQERERGQIERVTVEILSKNPSIVQLEQFMKAAEGAGITVQHPRKGELVLSITGSEHQFSDRELKPGGETFSTLYQTRVQANHELANRNQATVRSSEKEMGE